MSTDLPALPRWLAVSAGLDTDAVRLLPVPAPSIGPDVFCKLSAAEEQIARLRAALAAPPNATTAREIKNEVAIRGLTDLARDAALQCTSPDAMHATLTAFAHDVVDLACAALAAQQPAAKAFDAEGFRAWVLRNLPDNTIIGSGAWWADHLTAWAQRFAAAPAPAAPLTQAATDVLAERRRQVEVEGWTPEHDDAHGDGSMSIAAACYALHGIHKLGSRVINLSWLWKWTGWADHWFKPRDDRRPNLIRAAALLLAEIERLDRAHGITGDGTTPAAR